MNNPNQLITEITKLTSKIETEYPELYQFLDENPLTLPDIPHPEIDEAILRVYKESLEQLLRHYLQTHKKEH
jgi:hypothetical protein